MHATNVAQITLRVATLVVAATFARPASAQLSDSCGGGCPKLPQNSRSVSAEDTILATYPGNTLTATLAKGKKKTVLRAVGVLLENGHMVLAAFPESSISASA